MTSIIDHIDVEISYKIIELFSAGLYSSPNKAFEELICNSYDAFATKVSVFISPDLSNENSFILVCDNGEGLDQTEFHDLWKIGESNKRTISERDKKRLQIGRFGIGKLSTYILARKLTHISKKDGRYIMTTMDYANIHTDTKQISLPEEELTEKEAQILVEKYCIQNGKTILSFELFGEHSEKSWTISLLTDLKPKASEIQIGRLRWILSTALPLNNNSFSLYLNGQIVESSKTRIPILKEWIIGQDDITANEMDIVSTNYCKEQNEYYVNFESLPNVKGKFILYEQSLLGGKAESNGRSHGIFLIIRGRLINLDDPLLGMEPFSHGPFNHCQIIINADGLDDNLTSTREAVKDSVPLKQLKEYIKRKFNNEIRKYYFEYEEKEHEKKSISYRISQTAYTTSQKPIRSFLERFYDGRIVNPILIMKPISTKDTLMKSFEGNENSFSSIIQNVEWRILGTNDPVGRLDIEKKELTINILHPFVANYSDSFKNTTPLENIVITEVLTEAYLYEIGVDESQINSIIHRRDQTLRELAYSDKDAIPVVAQLLHDSLSNPVGLEDAVYRALKALGFETIKIGGNGKPDGMATAILGYDSEGKKRSYTLTYDAKSTSKNRISAGTAKLSGLNRHKKDYNATYSLEVAIDYEGGNDPDSAISKESILEKITVMRAKDLARLVLYSIPNHLGLSKLEDLFKNCYSPLQVSKWVDDFIQTPSIKVPYYEIIDVIYDFQKKDTEPPTVEVVRYTLNQKIKGNYSTSDIKTYLTALENIIPGQFHFDGTYAFVDTNPEIIRSHISQAINSTPIEMRKIYSAIFS